MGEETPLIGIVFVCRWINDLSLSFSSLSLFLTLQAKLYAWNIGRLQCSLEGSQCWRCCTTTVKVSDVQCHSLTDCVHAVECVAEMFVNYCLLFNFQPSIDILLFLNKFLLLLSDIVSLSSLSPSLLLFSLFLLQGFSLRLSYTLVQSLCSQNCLMFYSREVSAFTMSPLMTRKLGSKWL